MCFFPYQRQSVQPGPVFPAFPFMPVRQLRSQALISDVRHSYNLLQRWKTEAILSSMPARSGFWCAMFCKKKMPSQIIFSLFVCFSVEHQVYSFPSKHIEAAATCQSWSTNLRCSSPCSPEGTVRHSSICPCSSRRTSPPMRYPVRIKSHLCSSARCWWSDSR